MKKVSIVAFTAVFSLALFFAAATVQAAVPHAVSAAYEQMRSDGVDLRAGCHKTTGIFIVAKGTAPVGVNEFKAKEIARRKAHESIAGFFGTEIKSDSIHQIEELTSGDQTELREFFSKTSETQIEETLKGIQDLKSYVDGTTVVLWCYVTQKAQDKRKEFKAAIDSQPCEGYVTSVGEAKTHALAVQVALRTAVEQVVGTVVVGESKIADDKLLRDKIFAGAEGFVDEYRITQQLEITGGWRVSIAAKVSKKKILDSYRIYMKTLGDPVFYLDSDSDELSTRFAQFFADLGFKLSNVEDNAKYRIKATGNFREVKYPGNGRVGTQLSMTIKIFAIDGTEILASVENDPRKSACFVGSLDRQREICADKAFKQMRKPVHEAVNSMVAKMVGDHTDKVINGDK